MTSLQSFQISKDIEKLLFLDDLTLNFHLFKLEQVKFIYSEKATKFCEIFTLLLSYVVPVKSKVKISQNCVAFSEYMNFNSTYEQRQSGKKRFCKSGFEIIDCPVSTHYSNRKIILLYVNLL